MRRVRVRRADLDGPRVRVLNLGGLGNADVLEVHDAAGQVAIVKDYAARPAWVRAWLAPRLVQRELALLQRVEGTPGVPRPLGRIDSLALALERMQGEPLRRRTHSSAVPESFFAALESILEALRSRGVFYGDLRSPTNVMCTAHWAPVLVDLASASRLPAPRRALAWFYRRALAKLRARFESGPNAARARVEESGVRDLHAGRARIRTLDVGPASDPVPALFVPDGSMRGSELRGVLQVGVDGGRRALAIELPADGRGRRSRLPALTRGNGDAADPAARARWLERVLGLLRLPRVDLVAYGSSAGVARALVQRAPGRVRTLLEIAPADPAEPGPAGWASCPVPRVVLVGDPGAGAGSGASASERSRAHENDHARLLWKELTALVARATV